MSDIVTLIDGSNLCHRLYHAIGAERMADSARGQIESLCRFTGAKRMLVAFDAPGDNWRRAIYPAYKAQRTQRPAELDTAILRLIDSLTEAEGHEVGWMAGVEADDIIASECQHATETGHRVVIVSTDKDLYQLLVDGRVTQLTRFRTIGGKVSDPEWMRYQRLIDEFGFSPSQWPTYRALAGDTSDNVAGVKGIGDKSARNLLQQYRSIDLAVADRWNLLHILTQRQLTALRGAIGSGEFATMERISTLRRDLFEEAES